MVLKHHWKSLLHFHSAQGWAARSSQYNNFYHSFYTLELTHTHVPRRPSSFCDFWKSILPVLLHHLILLYYLCHEFSSIPVVLHIVAFLKRQPFQNLNCTMIYAYFKYVLNIARGPTDPGYWVRNMWISHSLQVGKSKQLFGESWERLGKFRKFAWDSPIDIIS